MTGAAVMVATMMEAQRAPDATPAPPMAEAMLAAARGDHRAALALWDACLGQAPERFGRDEYLAFADALLVANRPRKAADAFLPSHAPQAFDTLRARWPEAPQGWIGAAKLAEWHHAPAEACAHWRAVLDRFDAVAEPDWYEQYMTVVWLTYDHRLFNELRARLRARWPAHETVWDRRDGRRRRGSTAPDRQPSLGDVEDILRFGIPAEAKALLATLPDFDRDGATGRACAQIIRSIEHSDLMASLVEGGFDPSRPGTSIAWRNPAGSDRVIIAFSGGARGYWLLLDELHRVLRHCGAHVIYMRDFGQSYYLAGDPELGIADYRGMLDLVRGQAAALGATRIACLGNSAGGYAALRYALDLGAEAALAFSLQTNPEKLHDRQLAPVFNAIAQRNPGLVLDLPQAFAAAARTPRALLCFGADHANDEAEARRMAGLPGIRLVPAEGFGGHGAIRWFLQNDHLPGLVAALFSADAA